MPDVALRALDSWCASRPFYDVSVWPGQHGFTLTVIGAASDIQTAVNAACDVVRPWCMMVEPGCIRCVGYKEIVQ